MSDVREVISLALVNDGTGSAIICTNALILKCWNFDHFDPKLVSFFVEGWVNPPSP